MEELLGLIIGVYMSWVVFTISWNVFLPLIMLFIINNKREERIRQYCNKNDLSYSPIPDKNTKDKLKDYIENLLLLEVDGVDRDIIKYFEKLNNKK